MPTTLRVSGTLTTPRKRLLGFIGLPEKRHRISREIGLQDGISKVLDLGPFRVVAILSGLSVRLEAVLRDLPSVKHTLARFSLSEARSGYEIRREILGVRVDLVVSEV